MKMAKYLFCVFSLSLLLNMQVFSNTNSLNEFEKTVKQEAREFLSGEIETKEMDSWWENNKKAVMIGAAAAIVALAGGSIYLLNKDGKEEEEEEGTTKIGGHSLRERAKEGKAVTEQDRKRERDGLLKREIEREKEGMKSTDDYEFPNKKCC